MLTAACELFAERGYRATSMKDIAEAQDVKAPSLYNHVSSKQEILYSIMVVAMDRATAALDAALYGVDDVTEQLRRATESLVLDFVHHVSEVTVCNAEVRSLDAHNREAIIARRDDYAVRVRRIVEAGCTSGRFRTRSPQLASYAVLEMGNGAKSWFKPGGRFSDEHVAQQYGHFALHIVGDTAHSCEAPALPLDVGGPAVESGRHDQERGRARTGTQQHLSPARTATVDR